MERRKLKSSVFGEIQVFMDFASFFALVSGIFVVVRMEKCFYGAEKGVNCGAVWENVKYFR